jgi:hypothetical protein
LKIKSIFEKEKGVENSRADMWRLVIGYGE